MAQSSPIGRIDPSSLIGKADPDIVSPRAVAVLSDAFRSGQISANDIHDRVSEHAKAKQKMEITLANRATAEAQDPALEDARRQQLLAAGAQGQLAGAQATSDLGMVPLTAKAKQEAIEKAAGEAKYPAAKDFDELAAIGGVRAVPLTPTGAIDYAKKAEIGAQLKLWKTRQDIAKNELADVVGKESDTPTGTRVSSWTKQGLPVDPQIIERYKKDAKTPFVPQDLSPGSVLAPIAPTAIAPATVAPTDLRSSGEGDVSLPVELSVEPISTPAPEQLPTISTDVAPSQTPSVGAPLPGGGFQLGTRPPKETGAQEPVKMTGEQATALTQRFFTRDHLKKLRTASSNLDKGAPYTAGGTVAGAFGKAIFAEDRNPVLQDFKAAAAAITAPLVKGIFTETGVLSEEDIKRYKSNVPNVSMTPRVRQNALDSLEEDINTSIIAGVSGMDIQKQNLHPDLQILKQTAIKNLKEIQAEKAARLQVYIDGGTPEQADAAAAAVSAGSATPAAATGAAPAGSQPFLTLPPIGNNMFTAPGPKAAPVLKLSTGKTATRDPATGRRVVVRQ